MIFVFFLRLGKIVSTNFLKTNKSSYIKNQEYLRLRKTITSYSRLKIYVVFAHACFAVSHPKVVSMTKKTNHSNVEIPNEMTVYEHCPLSSMDPKKKMMCHKHFKSFLLVNQSKPCTTCLDMPLSFSPAKKSQFPPNSSVEISPLA